MSLLTVHLEDLKDNASVQVSFKKLEKESIMKNLL